MLPLGDEDAGAELLSADARRIRPPLPEYRCFVQCADEEASRRWPMA
jgi:hypothetical protein